MDTYSFEVTFPVNTSEHDSSIKDDVWAWGNFVKFSLNNPGGSRSITIDKITFKQKTVVIQKGLRAYVANAGFRTGSTAPISWQNADEYFINGKTDYRVYLKFDISDIQGVNITKARVGVLTSRYQDHEFNDFDLEPGAGYFIKCLGSSTFITTIP